MIILNIIFGLIAAASLVFAIRLLKNERRSVGREHIAKNELKTHQNNEKMLEKIIYRLENERDMYMDELEGQKDISEMLSERIECHKMRCAELEKSLETAENDAKYYKELEAIKNES